MELKPNTVSSSQDEKLEGQPLIKPSSTNHDLHESIVDACRSVFDPEIPVNIFDLGLIYTIEINRENSVSILMSLTAPGCPVAGEMPGWVERAVEMVPGVKDVKVELIWDPALNQEFTGFPAKI